MTFSSYVRPEMLPEQAPPIRESGAVRWLRENLFSGPVNTMLTLLGLAIVVWLVQAAYPWLRQSVWVADSLQECRAITIATWGEGATGACWAMIRERWTQFVFGFYPSHLYWRPTVALLLLFVSLAPILFSAVPRQLLWLTVIYPALAVWLMWGGSFWGPALITLTILAAIQTFRILARNHGPLLAAGGAALLVVLLYLDPLSGLKNLIGGVLGLFSADPVLLDFRLFGWQVRDAFPLIPHLQAVLDTVLPLSLEAVRSDKFGGFVLALTIGVSGIVLSLPLGILLALGRQSDMFLIKAMSVGFIEFIRGVPLITLLFVASLLLNYFLPPGTNFDIILRVIIMVTLFAAAYIAEVVRGGLAALPRGQYEAADSLGLNYWNAQRLIILPQALKISIPGIVSTFIGMFKDTTLVVFVGLLDPLKGITDAVRADIDWKGIYWEPYIFVASIFFIFNFSMSRYSMYLERKLKTDHR
ncbi:amino acid ABC transporter permease [Paracoccaceae bacterium Fryx2]|nr:amino acid ABC transporter permease [Paracoccaceae bacterium Fryx2]